MIDFGLVISDGKVSYDELLLYMTKLGEKMDASQFDKLIADTETSLGSYTPR